MSPPTVPTGSSSTISRQPWRASTKRRGAAVRRWPGIRSTPAGCSTPTGRYRMRTGARAAHRPSIPHLGCPQEGVLGRFPPPRARRRRHVPALRAPRRGPRLVTRCRSVAGPRRTRPGGAACTVVVALSSPELARARRCKALAAHLRPAGRTLDDGTRRHPRAAAGRRGTRPLRRRTSADVHPVAGFGGVQRGR